MTAAPSKKDLSISKLRIFALQNGFRLGTNELKDKFRLFEQNLEIYTIKNVSQFTSGHFIRGNFGWELYEPTSLKKSLSFDMQLDIVNKFPELILEIIFFESNIAFLWKEKKDLEILEHIKSIFN